MRLKGYSHKVEGVARYKPLVVQQQTLSFHMWVGALEGGRVVGGKAGGVLQKIVTHIVAIGRIGQEKAF